MQKLPDLKDIELVSTKESLSTFSNLQKTENILKRLLINIEAFKQIESDNIQLRDMLLKNQNQLKQEYKKKLEALAYLIKEKESGKDNAKENAIKQYKTFAEKLVRKMLIESERSLLVQKKYAELYLLSKKLNEDNKRLKELFLRHKEILKSEVDNKIKTSVSNLKSLVEAKHKGLLKEHEEMKIELDKKVVIEKKRNEFLTKKYASLLMGFGKLEKDYAKIEALNHKLIQRLAFLEKKSMANESVVIARTEIMKGFFDKKLREMAKMQIDKEIDYKTKIDSLSKDLAKYYTELKKSKQRYYFREKELKEKLKEILN